MDELDEVIGKLSCAALQISLKDDQIIAAHIRDSVALLLKYRHKIRERVLSKNIREHVSEVECPSCKGHRDVCRLCNGSGSVTERAAVEWSPQH